MDPFVTQQKAELHKPREMREWLAAYDASRDAAVTLLLIGIRDLKQINEREGRAGGDAAIRQTGDLLLKFAEQQLVSFVRIGRMPGREFVAVLEGRLSRAQLDTLCLDMVDWLSTDPGKQEHSIRISPRIGIARSNADESGMDILQRATAALAEAYAGKGARIAYAKSGSGQAANRARQLDMELPQAIAQGSLSVMFQPQFMAKTLQLKGAEALVRWHHPILGEVGADALFAAADRCDLREELSQLIQKKALETAAIWPMALDMLQLSINLGAGELHAGLAEKLMAMIIQSGFAPNRLTLELTEESLIQDVEMASILLESLRNKGVSIALDDFGTGFSSLAYLNALPLDYLKIDKAMIHAMEHNGPSHGKDRIVARAIIALGQALGMKVIAEGVETKQQLLQLQEDGCDYVQGFLLSPPLTPSEFEAFALRSD